MLADGTGRARRRRHIMAVEVAATRRRFTRKDYYRMVEAGILRARDRVELIEGEIIEMSPIGPRHSAFVDNLTRLLVRRLPDDAIVRVQGPVALADDTEPQPDLTVLRRRAVAYKDREAWAEDAVLVIEVAESSLAYDRITKRRLYAQAGIPEYWIVDCGAETVEVYRTPGPDGYGYVHLVTGAATLAPEAFPDVELSTTEIFA
jgi:Uma2 family endonuclease